MNHILVAIDGSSWSQVAAEYALDFARARNREVVGLAVMSPEIVESLGETPETIAYSPKIPEGEQLGRRAIDEWFSHTEAACEEMGLCYHRAVEVGKPDELLVWKSMLASLTVFGARGANARENPNELLGKISRTMLRRSIKPMLITRESYRPVNRVVLGWDEHPDSAHAAEWVLDMAVIQNWEVIVVSGTEEHSDLASSCSRLVRAFSNDGVPADSYIAPGNAPTVIWEAVKRFQPDMIALGARPKGQAARLFQGGSWEEIAEQADVPVLLYR
jgi:nucleotide-binding universal stress UspA family protein